MSDRVTTRGQQAGQKAAQSESTTQTTPRIRIDVPLGTPYQEIRDSILRQAWLLAGTQLRAAIALGITPETVSRNLRRAERDRAVQDRTISSSDHRVVALQAETAESSISKNQAVSSADDPVTGGESASPASPSFAERVSRSTRMAGLHDIEGGGQIAAPVPPFHENDTEENDSASGFSNDAEQRDLL